MTHERSYSRVIMDPLDTSVSLSSDPTLKEMIFSPSGTHRAMPEYFGLDDTRHSDFFETPSLAIDTLFEQVRHLQIEVIRLAAQAAQSEAAATKTIVVREIDEKTAKNEIKAFFEEHHGETIYPDEVAQFLSLDVEQAIQLCMEIEAEGGIVQA